MAKKEKKEIVTIKWMRLACFAISVIFFAIVYWGNQIINAPENNIFGYTIEFFTHEENIQAVFQSTTTTSIVAFFMIIFILLLSLCVTLKMICMFFNVLGFIGKKDAYKRAKKFSKYIKRAFAAIGLEITALLLFTFDDGVFTKDIKTFLVVVGIAFAVVYFGVRAYRWFLVEKMSLVDMAFILAKDLIFIGVFIYLITLVDTRVIGTFIQIETLFNSNMTSPVLADKMYSFAFSLVNEVFKFIFLTAVMRKTLKFFPLNNYKKPVYSRYAGNYIALVILIAIYSALGHIIYPLIEQNMASVNVVNVILGVLPQLIPYVLAIVAVCLAGSIEGGYVKEIKLYVPGATTEEVPTTEEVASEEVATEETAETEEQVEEPAEEVPAEEKVEEAPATEAVEEAVEEEPKKAKKAKKSKE